MISEEIFWYCGRFEHVVELVNWSAVFFFDTLFVTAFAFNHVYKAFRVAVNVVSNWSCFACGMECVRSKPDGYVGTRARRKIAAAFSIPHANGKNLMLISRFRAVIKVLFCSILHALVHTGTKYMITMTSAHLLKKFLRVHPFCLCVVL